MDFLNIEILLALYFGLVVLTNAQQSSVTITPSDKNIAKFIGENFFISCNSNDNLPMQWENPRNEKIQSGEQNRIRTEAGVGLELYFSNVKMEDSGVYTCKSRNGITAFNLTVVRPIVFEPNLALQTAKEGHDFVMRCKASGHTSNPRIQWKIDYNPPKGRFRQQPDGNLHISRVMESDARHRFLCRAMEVNSARPDSKDLAITLKVQMKPKLIGPSRKDQYGVDGRWANLSCSVVAEPLAKFDWFFNNKRLWTSDELLFQNPTNNTSILQVYIKRSSDFGDYICRASNNIGAVNQTLSLRRAKKPKTPTLEAIHIGSVGVAVKAKYLNDGNRFNDPAFEGDKKTRAEELPVIGYAVEYKMLKKEWTTAPNVTQTSYGFIIRGLVPNVTYFIRAAAKNAASLGEYSAELKINTPRNVQFNPPASGVGKCNPSILQFYSLLTIIYIVLSKF